jgi:hypothetical protein
MAQKNIGKLVPDQKELLYWIEDHLMTLLMESYVFYFGVNRKFFNMLSNL